MGEASAHSLWGPSSAARRLACPGSALAERDLPEKENPYSLEGTMQHSVLSWVLTSDSEDVTAHSYVGCEFPHPVKDLVFGVDHASRVQRVADRVQCLPGDVWSERGVDLSAWVSGCFGTLDMAVVDEGALHIRDAKFGFGTPVYAEENPQLMLYTVGFAEDPEVRRIYGDDWIKALRRGDIPVYLEIDQPSLGHFDSWKTIFARCLQFAETYSSHCKAVACGEMRYRRPGPEQCLYCRALSRCRPAFDYFLQPLGLSIEDLETMTEEEIAERVSQNKEDLTPETRALLVRSKGVLTKALESLEDRVREDYHAGRDVGPIKLIPGSRRRAWSDEEQAAAELEKRLGKKQAYQRTVLSPAQAMEQVGPRVAKKLETLVTYQETKPRIVPADHPEEALPRSTDHFEDLDSGDDLDLDDFSLEVTDEELDDLDLDI